MKAAPVSGFQTNLVFMYSSNELSLLEQLGWLTQVTDFGRVLSIAISMLFLVRFLRQGEQLLGRLY